MGELPQFFDEPKSRDLENVLKHCKLGGAEECAAEISPPGKIKTHEDFQAGLRALLDQLFETLVDKNRAYGNSALNPIRVFSRASFLEQLNVRIDDKLSRLRAQDPGDSEDTELDLIGYLCLRRLGRLSNFG